MPGHTRLYRRGATYYHRAAVPVDIIATYPKTEETFSLKTKDSAEALRRVRVEAVKVDERFEQHRRWLAVQDDPYVDELTSEQLALIKQTYIYHLLNEDDDVRLDGFEDPDDPEIVYEPRSTFEEYNELVDDMNEVNRHNLARGKQDPFFVAEAEDVLEWPEIDIRLSPASPDRKKVVRALQEAAVEAAEVKRKRSLGDVIPTPEAPAQGAVSAPNGPLLSILFKNFVREKQRSKRWSSKLNDDYHNWAGTFIELSGDRPLSTYKKADARIFKELLLRLPKNRYKMSATKGLSLKEAADKADVMDMERLSTSTINKGLTRLGTFWNWLESNYDGAEPNMFKGLKLDDPVKARDQRYPFTDVQLQRIFDGPIYRGCQSESRRKESGSTNMSHTRWFWLPLMSLFSGARLNELCQLRVADV